MRITIYVNDGTKLCGSIRHDYMYAYGDIHSRYTRPSTAKEHSFNSIRSDYLHNDTTKYGTPCKTVFVPAKMKKPNNTMYLRYINGTMQVAGASCHQYSTTALFEDVETGERYIVKETVCNTYMTPQ